ncbi:unnamed protein product [Protopolystoma xenopodis]|uniref:GATOR2 complex protein MIO zinc-ribbon like domain-containing protein n=1 Tax=Protopolystoma xenopodis TaxID=117903 RepID=A0A448XGG8_9PLAT|nr:unnamed protein product [Protopolystoma xenopodis]
MTRLVDDAGEASGNVPTPLFFAGTVEPSRGHKTRSSRNNPICGSASSPIYQRVFVACGFCGWRLNQPAGSRRPGSSHQQQHNQMGGSSNLSSGVSSFGLGGSGISTSGGSNIGNNNTCNGGLASAMAALQMHGGGGKQTICHHCRKPLPRCSVCLMRLGSTAVMMDTNFAEPSPGLVV